MMEELVEQAARTLRCEPTRTLDARTLHRRTCAALGVGVSLSRFLQLLASRAETFTVVVDRALMEGWSAAEQSDYAAALERVGFVRSPTVLLAEPARHDARSCEAADPDASLGAALADTHAAMLELAQLDAMAGRDSTAMADAALQLEELRLAYAAQLRRSRR